MASDQEVILVDGLEDVVSVAVAEPEPEPEPQPRVSRTLDLEFGMAGDDRDAQEAPGGSDEAEVADGDMGGDGDGADMGGRIPATAFTRADVDDVGDGSEAGSDEAVDGDDEGEDEDEDAPVEARADPRDVVGEQPESPKRLLTPDEAEREHELEHSIQMHKHAQHRRLCICCLLVLVPFGVMGLGIAAGLFSWTGDLVSEDFSCGALIVGELPAEASRICRANADKGCCYDVIGRNCSSTSSDGSQCRERCQPGWLSTAGDGLPPCVECLPGYADIDLDPVTPCSKCDVGSYAGHGDTECAACLQGQADTDMRTDTPCTACSPGQESLDRDGENGWNSSWYISCGDCAPGTTDDDDEPKTSCSACPAGTYSAAGMVGECHSCEGGTFSDEGAERCTACSAGTTDLDSSPETPCVTCGRGKISGVQHTGACDACATGETSYQPFVECQG